MSKFTKGPWMVWKDGVYAVNKGTVATPITLTGYRGTICMMDDLDEEIPERQQKANAHLIAAAPDLLASLKELLQDKYEAKVLTDEDGEMLSRAEAAIAKARGESP